MLLRAKIGKCQRVLLIVDMGGWTVKASLRAWVTWIAVTCCGLMAVVAEEKPAPKYDIVIRGGRVVDGTGAPWFRADVGILDGKITDVGRIDPSAAKQVIDAQGLVVAPGFVDMMGQTASPMVRDAETAMNLLTQGITTINAGEGASAAPLSQAEGKDRGWTTMAEYFALLDLQGLPVNVVQTVGHTQVRRLVLGDVERRPSDQEMKRMQEFVREAMEAGAIGVSTALIYPPAVYARTQEIAALAEVAGQFGGRYYTHMRNEGDQLLEAIDEALDIGKTGHAPVHIFHLKAAGRQNWGKMPLALAKIKAARAGGQQVTADIYPYVNNGLGIAAFIHPRHFSQGRAQLLARLDDPELRAQIRREMETTGGWENWYRHVGNDWGRVVIGQTSHPDYRELVGKTVAEMAQSRKEDVWETFFKLVQAGAFALPESMTDANKIMAMQEPFISFCTDVGPAGGGRSASHPRAFGSFPRLLARYVRDLGAISLEQAVSQASAAACNDIMAYDRGRIAEGLAADVIVFDYQQLADQATFANPHQRSVGMKHVLVNGTPVLQDGQFTGRRPGRVLRGPGYDEQRAPHQRKARDGDARMESFDTMIADLMRKHCTPGLALAVTDQGRLVYHQGYGIANLAGDEQVTSQSLFRIASISKPITAVAILQLVEQGKLDLDDKVFEVLDYEAEIDATESFDPRQREITIRHLLQHRGGWDRGASFDAMFQSVRFARQFAVPAPADQTTVIRAMLGVELDFDPGAKYAYSNYGYCLLGRVIETVAEVPYEQYVRQHVLVPLGIRDMRLGRTLREQRYANEVCYYHPGVVPSVFAANLGETVPSPYGGWFLEAMDSHGAWVASAVDLARFACAFDDPDRCPILSRASIELMYARPAKTAGQGDTDPSDWYYSLGWSNRVIGQGQLNHWHSGSLPGTTTILIRRHDGRNFIALLNARATPTTDAVSRDLDRLLHRAANAVQEWPTHNLFDGLPAEQTPGVTAP